MGWNIPLQLVTLQELLSQLSRPGFSHSHLGNRTKRIVHTVTERIDLLLVEVIILKLLPLLCLALDDLLEHLLVVLSRRDRCGYVLAVELLWHNEGQCHTTASCSRCPTNTVGI